jgi:hypothetical protein
MLEETIIEAFKRKQKIPASHFVDIKTNNDDRKNLTRNVVRRKKAKSYVDSSDEEEEESDSDNDAFMIPAYGEESDEENYYVYPAERSIKTGVKARQEHFDGVYPPARKDNRDQDKGSKGKENVIGNNPMTALRPKLVSASKKEPVIKEKSNLLAKSGT